MQVATAKGVSEAPPPLLLRARQHSIAAACGSNAGLRRGRGASGGLTPSIASSSGAAPKSVESTAANGEATVNDSAAHSVVAEAAAFDHLHRVARAVAAVPLLPVDAQVGEPKIFSPT